MRQAQRTIKRKPAGPKPLSKAAANQQMKPVESPFVFYTLRLMLAEHPDYIMLRVSRAEHDRVMRRIQNNSLDTFLLVECIDEVVAVRLKDVALINFCFDFGEPEPGPDPDDLPYEINLQLKGRTEPLSIEVEPDKPSASEEDTEEIGQLGNLLYMLELSDDQPGTTHFLEDVDGEPVIMLESNLSMVRVPKYLIPVGASHNNAVGEESTSET
jgi:hypothetical protein